MPQKITYRKFIEGDIARISEFRKKFFLYDSSIRSYEPEYYEWKFNKNPVLPGEIWLAEDGNTLVGIDSGGGYLPC